jgi:hypothetical protein
MEPLLAAKLHPAKEISMTLLRQRMIEDMQCSISAPEETQKGGRINH